MFKNPLALLAIASLFSSPLVSNPLSPQTPVTIATGVNSARINLYGTSSGFMTGWEGNSNDAQESFSSDLGQTWVLSQNPPSPSLFGFFQNSISGLQDTFVWPYASPDPGGGVGYLYVNTSTNKGQSWNSPIIINRNQEVDDVKSSLSNKSFMIVSSNMTQNRVEFSYSTDGLTWPLLQPLPLASNLNIATSLAGNPNGFLATWQTTSFEGYASFSSNEGGAWTAPTLVATEMSAATNLSVYGTRAGFMAVWVDNAGLAWSRFSSDNGATWSQKSQIASEVTLNFTDVTISGNTSGFVVAWQSNSNIGYASFSSDLGVTWSEPVQITRNIAGSIYASIAVSIFGPHCMFGWVDQSQTAWSCYSTVPYTPPVTTSATQLLLNAVQQVTPIRPQR